MGYLIQTFLLSLLVHGATYRMNPKLSTSAEDIYFLTRELEKTLAPADFALIPDSLDISESILVGDPGSFNPVIPVILETPQYAARLVLFDARKKSDGKIWRGKTYLMVVREKDGAPAVPVNSTAEKRYNDGWRRHFYMILSTGYLPENFTIEVRPSDLILFPKEEFSYFSTSNCNKVLKVP